LLNTNARRPIKGSKDADFYAVFVKKRNKNCPWGWSPKIDECGPKKA